MRLTVMLLLLMSAFHVMALDAPPALQFDIARFEVVGENPLTPEEVEKVLKPFLGRHHGLEGLSAASDELERLLKKKGYSFHRVVLLPQSLASGVVQLQILEFKLGTATVKGNKHFSTENIRQSLPNLVEGLAPNTRLLGRSLQLANQHPDKSLQLAFKEGTKANTIDIDLEVADKSPHTAYVLLNNTGTEATGEYRLGIGYQYSNLFRRDHIASVNYSTSTEEPDNVAQYALSYRMPFYRQGDHLTLYYSDSQIETTASLETFSQNFDVTGAGTIYGGRYSYVLKKVKGYRQSVVFGLDDKTFDNQVLFGGSATNGTNKFQSRPLTLQYQIGRKTPLHQFNFNIGISTNLVDDQEAYDIEERSEGSKPDTGWSVLRYSGKYERNLGRWMFRFKLNGQAADEILISGEQYGLGGASSVRGYDERSMLGDKGYYYGLELWSPVTKRRLRGLFFYDAGKTSYIEDIGTGIFEQTPSSAGIGLRWAWTTHLNLALDYASVLEDAGSQETGDGKFHLNVVYLF